MKEKAQISMIFDRLHSGQTAPILLQFQNGNLAPINKENTELCSYKNEVNKRKGSLVIANGEMYAGEHIDNELADSYICLRNKISNKVRVIPIDKVSLLNQVYYKLDQEIVKKNIMTEKESVQTLLKQFGGRKASRFVDNQEKMKMDISIVKNELDSTIKFTKIDESDPALSKGQDGEAHFNSIRPPCNKDANQINEIYTVTDVVPENLLFRLNEESKLIFATAVEKLPIQSQYLRDCISEIQKSSAGPDSFLKIKLVIYMDCLQTLITSKARSMTNTELSKITEKVENDVRARFSDPKGKKNIRTTFSVEKALCHYIVLALLVSNNYQVDINILTKELCAPRLKIVRFAQIVYAQAKRNTDYLQLCLPSKVPTLQNSTFRRKK